MQCAQTANVTCKLDDLLWCKNRRIVCFLCRALKGPNLISKIKYYINNYKTITIRSYGNIWILTLKWSVRVFEYLSAVLCLWQNMAICRRDWHFKLRDTIKCWWIIHNSHDSLMKTQNRLVLNIVLLFVCTFFLIFTCKNNFSGLGNVVGETTSHNKEETIFRCVGVFYQTGQQFQDGTNSFQLVKHNIPI